MRIAVGFGGWCRITTDSGRFYVRLAEEGPERRLVIAEFYMHAQPMTATSLRQVPLGRIEAWVNVDEGVRDAVRSQLQFPGPDLATATAFFSTSFTKPGQHWAADMMFSQITGSGVPRPRPPKDDANAEHHQQPVQQPVDLKLSCRPSGRPSRANPYSEEFYREVVQIYAGLASQVRDPAARIADANGVPVTTVHRWVKEARRRGLLRAGTPGKVG